MKNTRKFIGFAVIAAITLAALSLTACPPPDDDGTTQTGGKTLVSIAVTTQPTKTQYNIGDTTLDTAGMVVTATYSDSTTEAVTGYTTSGFDSATAEQKTVTVSYGGKTAAFTVTVNPAGSTTLTSVDEVAAYLNAQTGKGDNADNPASLPMQINLGNMSQDGSGWRQLLDAIKATGKYVDLDLSACTMTGTDFSPGDMFGDMGQTGREKIVSIVLPSTATSIGADPSGGMGMGAFRNFTNLKTFSGGNITVIGNRAFSDCTSLAITELPAGLQTIGMGAFAGCTGLTQLTLPNSVTSIGGAAFSSCENLTSISIPASAAISNNSGNVFSNCASLTSFTVTGSGSLNVIEGGKALADGTELIAYPSASGSITVPSGLTSIGSGVFSVNRNLTQVTLPVGIISIEGSAFSGCWNLSQINLPEGLVTIGAYAFNSCSSLEQITLPDSITFIELSAFEGCTGLTEIVLPAKLESLGTWGTFRNCPNLTLVTCLAVTPPEAGWQTFTYTSSSLAIKVPAASVEAYKAAWSEYGYADKIVAIE